jgi:hypothetical protein
MTWIAFFANMAACGGFVAVAALRAKRIGGVAPWLLALVGAVDAGLFLLFRLFDVLSDPYNGFETSRSLVTLELLDGLTMYGLGVLVLVAFYMLMPPTTRRA